MNRRALVLALALGVLFARSAFADETVPNTLTEAEKKAGFKLLFDGKTTDGWRGYKMKKMPSGWKVIDGVLTRVAGGAGGKGAGGGDDIITVDPYDNFELVLQWRLGKGVNSGILYRVIEDAVTSWHVAPEMQVVDNVGWGESNRTHHAAALYDLYAPTKDTSRPPGNWNDVKLVANGNHIEHWLNGEKVVQCEINSADWKERVAKSKFKDKPKFAKATKGYICLQDHSGRVEYRSIKLRPIRAE
jgi:cytochrome c